jgi:hypothetical protein
MFGSGRGAFVCELTRLEGAIPDVMNGDGDPFTHSP